MIESETMYAVEFRYTGKDSVSIVRFATMADATTAIEAAMPALESFWLWPETK